MKKKIGLFAGTDRGLKVLSALIEAGHEVAGVLALEQEKHEINNCTKKIVELAKKNNIKVKTAAEVKPIDYHDYLNQAKLDVLFVVSWRFMIPENCFNLVEKGIFIVHDSFLPKYRGFAPTNWVIINQEKETGLSLIYIDKKPDAGDIVDQIRITIKKDETAKTLNDKFLKIYPEIILKNIESILTNQNKRIAQDSSKASYAKKRRPEDGKINLNHSTRRILSFIRGLTYPYPGAFCYYRNKKVIIWEAKNLAKPDQNNDAISGKISRITDNFVDVFTKDGIMRITKIGLENSPNVFLRPKDIFNSISHRIE